MKQCKRYFWLIEGVMVDDLLESFEKMGLEVNEKKKIRASDEFEFSEFKIGLGDGKGSFKFNTYRGNIVRNVFVKSYVGLDLLKRVFIFLRIPYIDRDMCVEYREEHDQDMELSIKELLKILMPDVYNRFYGYYEFNNYPHLIQEERA